MPDISPEVMKELLALERFAFDGQAQAPQMRSAFGVSCGSHIPVSTADNDLYISPGLRA